MSLEIQHAASRAEQERRNIVMKTAAMRFATDSDRLREVAFRAWKDLTEACRVAREAEVRRRQQLLKVTAMSFNRDVANTRKATFKAWRDEMREQKVLREQTKCYVQ